MKKSIKLITVLSLILFFVTSLAAEIETIDKETAEMKVLRNKSAQLRIAKLNLAVKYGRISKDKANYLIRKIKFMTAFKNNNPEWIKYGRKFRRWHRKYRKMGRRRGMRMHRRGRMHGKRGMRKGRKSKWCEWRKNLKKEPAEMRTIRHKKAEIKILKIRFALKNGLITAGKAAYKIKKIKAIHQFKDRNPDWVQYKRFGKRRGGCRKGFRHHRRMRRHRGRRRHY